VAELTYLSAADTGAALGRVMAMVDANRMTVITDALSLQPLSSVH